MKLFQYAVIYQPDEAERKNGAKPEIVIDLKTVLAESESVVGMMAAREIPDGFKDKLSRMEVAVRPF